MRIAIDARIINSGTGRYIERLIHYLEELDTAHEYLILVRKKDLDYYKPRKPNFKVIEAEFADYSFGEQLGLARLLYRLKADLVHFCMPQQPLFYFRPAVTSILDLNLLRITKNDTMGPIELAVKKAIFAILLQIVAHRTRHIITISNYSKQDILKFTHVKSEKITVTHLGADKVTATPQPVAALQGKEFIMYVGRAEPYKNNRGLISAHQQLLQKYPELRLVIVGRQDDMRKSDMQWVKDKGYRNIDFMGFMSDEELAWLYANCQAYVFPSFMEGFGLPGLEAMAYGAPVVSSNKASLPEVYGNAAIYFDPSKTAEMAQKIDQVISSGQIRQELITKGHQMHAKYSWQRMAEQILTVYNSQLEQK